MSENKGTFYDQIGMTQTPVAKNTGSDDGYDEDDNNNNDNDDDNDYNDKIMMMIMTIITVIMMKIRM